mgnify:CR=1 FL=1
MCDDCVVAWRRALACCFFFQAEDGIRDLVRSRGLGDVYKRQAGSGPGPFDRGAPSFERRRSDDGHAPRAGADPAPVSYTHLTLPTSDLV